MLGNEQRSAIAFLNNHEKSSSKCCAFLKFILQCTSVSDYKVLCLFLLLFVVSSSWQDELARDSSERIVERSDAAVAKVVQQGQGSRSGRAAGPRGGGRGRGGGETSAADKKTSLRGSVRAHAENTLAHGKQPALSVRSRPEGKRETVRRIISVLTNAVPHNGQ